MTGSSKGGRPLPLAGLRLLDFSQGVAGPYCAMLLADLGANVIKIEPPEGDWSRTVGSQLQPHESSAHLCLNRGKCSVCLNLKNSHGRTAAIRLATRADILVHNFRPGVMENFGLGYATLAATNHRIVYGTITGFGEEGPRARAPATDSIMQAFGGLMSINGDRDGLPLRMGNMVSDMLAGMYLSQGILAALMGRGDGGSGQHVRVSLLDALVAFQSAPLMEYLQTGRLPGRNGQSHPLIAPSGTYAARDGLITLVATQRIWPRLCEAMGLPDLASEARFATNEARLANREALEGIVAKFVAGRTRAEMQALADAHDFAYAPIHDYGELVQDAQVKTNELIRPWTHPVLGERLGIRSPVRYSSMELAWRAPPMLGEHTESVLADDLGYSIQETKAASAANLGARTDL